jgi:hypothetical protein
VSAAIVRSPEPSSNEPISGEDRRAPDIGLSRRISSDYLNDHSLMPYMFNKEAGYE